MHTPDSPEALAALLGECNDANRTIHIGGAGTKYRMAGPIAAADVRISTRALNRVLQFEPKDLTISVEAGMPYSTLTRLLDEHGMMVPLDPPFAASATIGGVVASNSSGPRRRLYGAARDLVIGMKFGTMEGKLVQSGGMVVKNVAGLDMGKLMIGSFGTLAAMAVLNFKLIPKPPAQRTFLIARETPTEAIAARNAILHGILQPSAVDLLNPEAAALAGLNGWCLLVQAGGSGAVLERYAAEMPPFADVDEAVWDAVREMTPRFLAAYTEGGVVRISTTLEQVAEVMQNWTGPMLARAANGVCYGYSATAPVVPDAVKGVVEYSPETRNVDSVLWPFPGSDLAMMKRVKDMMDPQGLLNRGRLYGRI